jgi:hypothetical protein
VVTQDDVINNQRGWWHQETFVVVDASPVGVSAILSQKSPNVANSKVIAYASRALSPVETRYSQTERETLAIVCAVEHFHMFLFGHHHCNIFPSSGCREASVKRGRELMRVLSLALHRQLLYGASVAKWLAHLPFTSEAAGSSDSNPVLM